MNERMNDQKLTDTMMNLVGLAHGIKSQIFGWLNLGDWFWINEWMIESFERMNEWTNELTNERMNE